MIRYEMPSVKATVSEVPELGIVKGSRKRRTPSHCIQYACPSNLLMPRVYMYEEEVVWKKERRMSELSNTKT